MHYADGTKAEIGDRVRGIGYNLKNADGTPREFEGVVAHVVPGSDSCNIQVAHVVPATMNQYFVDGKSIDVPQSGTINVGRIAVRVEIEYGECKAFRKVG